jgi:hypothetical protein
MASPTEIGQAGLQGWREKVGDGVASPIAKRTSFDEDQVRGAIGVLFFVLSVMYVVKTITEASKQLRDS